MKIEQREKFNRYLDYISEGLVIERLQVESKRAFFTALKDLSIEQIEEIAVSAVKHFKPHGKTWFPSPAELLELLPRVPEYRGPSREEAKHIMSNFRSAETFSCARCKSSGFVMLYYRLDPELHLPRLIPGMTVCESADRHYREQFRNRTLNSPIYLFPLFDMPKPPTPDCVGFTVRCDCPQGKEQHDANDSIEIYLRRDLEFIEARKEVKTFRTDQG